MLWLVSLHLRRQHRFNGGSPRSFLVVIVGLWFVKWQPYYGKAFTAAETHSIGKSILANGDANPLAAAWDYALVYFPGGMESGGIRRAAGIAYSGADPA